MSDRRAAGAGDERAQTGVAPTDVQVPLRHEDGAPVEGRPGRIDLPRASQADRRAAVDALVASRDLGDALAYLERVLADCLTWHEGEPRARRGWVRRGGRMRERWRRGRRPASIR